MRRSRRDVCVAVVDVGVGVGRLGGLAAGLRGRWVWLRGYGDSVVLRARRDLERELLRELGELPGVVVDAVAGADDVRSW